MKRLLTIALCALALTACDKKESKFKGNDAPIYINGKDNMSKLKALTDAEDSQTTLTVHEILEQSKDESSLLALWGEHEGGLFMKCFSLSDPHKNIDLVNDRLIMEAINVIEDERIGKYGDIFLMSRNYKLIRFNGIENEDGDTLGYIPNSVIREAEAKILDLWKEGKITEIYRTFNDTFVFYPCTGKQFREHYKEDIDWEHEYDFLLPEHEHTHEITW